MDFWRFVWRRKWLLVVPVLVSTLAAGIMTHRTPAIYRSQARIMVVPQSVPESFVPTSVDRKLEDRLASIREQILSRTTLERIVTQFNLYETERKSRTMQDVIERMRTGDVRIETMPRGKGGDAAFAVSFQSKDPRTAMRVTEKLASLFINENLEVRIRQADNTNRFLGEHIEALANEVDELAVRIERDQLAHRTSPRSVVLEYEGLQSTYRELLVKRQQARIAANMENRQIGEQFKVIDPARIPERPEGPGNLSVRLFGAGAGLAAGLLMMLAASMRRPTPPAPGFPTAVAAAE